MSLWRVPCCGLLPQLSVGLLGEERERRVVFLGHRWRSKMGSGGLSVVRSSRTSGVESGDCRSLLFRRLPRRTDIKTVFWYSQNTCCSKTSPDREPLRVKIPELPDVFVVSIESDNTGRIVSRCPNAIKLPSRKKIAREVQSALIRVG